MDHITEAFYNVMYQYRLAFTPDGVQANLDLWRQQKTPLLELLRRHPNWREQELAVVFDLSEQRQLDRACVDETKFEMLTLAEEAGLTGERLEEFRDALDAATADYATVPDESRLPVIRNRGHIKCDAGMKAILYWKGVTKASAFVCFIWGCAVAVIQLVITLGGVDVSGWGPVLGYIFKSSINSGVIAMVGGLILVPVVSLFTKKQEKKVIDDLFACYEEKVMTTRKEALEDE